MLVPSDMHGVGASTQKVGNVHLLEERLPAMMSYVLYLDMCLQVPESDPGPPLISERDSMRHAQRSSR